MEKEVLTKEIKQEIKDRVIARVMLIVGLFLFIFSLIAIECYDAKTILSFSGLVLGMISAFVGSMVIIGEDDIDR